MFRQTVFQGLKGLLGYGYVCNSLWRVQYNTVQWKLYNNHCSYWYVNIISLCASNKKCHIFSPNPVIARRSLLWSVCEWHILCVYVPGISRVTSMCLSPNQLSAVGFGSSCREPFWARAAGLFHTHRCLTRIAWRIVFLPFGRCLRCMLIANVYFHLRAMYNYVCFFPLLVLHLLLWTRFDYLTAIRNDWQVILMKSHVFTALNVADVSNCQPGHKLALVFFFLNIG